MTNHMIMNASRGSILKFDHKLVVFENRLSQIYLQDVRSVALSLRANGGTVI